MTPPALTRTVPGGFAAVCLACGRRLPTTYRLRSLALDALRGHASTTHGRWAA